MHNLFYLIKTIKNSLQLAYTDQKNYLEKYIQKFIYSNAQIAKQVDI